MNKPHILLLGGWNAVFESAKKSGFNISYFGSFEENSAFNTKWLNDFYHCQNLDITKNVLCLWYAKKLHAKHPIDIVLSFSEFGLESSSIIADSLNIYGLDMSTVILTKYKDKMRNHLNYFPNLSLPYLYLKDKNSLTKFYEKNNQSIIIKPISGAASVGVRQIHSKNELDLYIKNNPNIFNSNYMVEKFIDSHHTYSTESISINGKHTIISISLSHNTGAPYNIISYTTVPPEQISEAEKAELTNTTINFLNAISLKNGVAHTELKIDKQGKAYIIESQTRVGGDRIWQMSELTTKFPQLQLCMESFIKPVELPAIKQNGVAGFFSLLPPEGKVVSVSDITPYINKEYVLEYDIKIKPNMTIERITDNTGRYGSFLIKAENHNQLFDRVKEIYNNIHIGYENGTTWTPSLERIKF